MKVKLKKPVSWFGPYQLAEALCFWAPSTKDQYGFKEKPDWSDQYCFKEKPDWVHHFGEFLAGEKQKSLLTKFLTWYDKKRRQFPWNKDVIKIHYYDTWSMDHTLSPIILPMLKQLKATKHGYGMIDDGDVPKHLQSIYAFPDEPWEWDKNAEARYEWVLDEMIWTFEQLCDDDHESQFYDHSEVDYDADIMSQVGKMKVDREGLNTHNARIDRGLVLFGKYFRTLWD